MEQQATGTTRQETPAIPPLEVADLPERTLPFWKMTGPGAVLVGLAIGAGELLIWPRITALYGATMIWAAALGVMVQLVINIEIGRWAICTGESMYTGYARVWRGFAVAFIAFNFFSWFLPGWARVSGGALKAIIFGPKHPSPDWLWTGITFAMVAVVLFGPKRIYATVERFVTVMVMIITLGLLFIAVKLGTWDSVVAMGKGLANVGFKEPTYSVKELFIAIVFAGAGGTGNLFYAYYLRDKRIGMGGRVPLLLNPFRKRDEATCRVGYIFPDTADNRSRFREWFKFVILDQALFFWLLNTFTILLFIFAALVAMRPLGVVPEQGQMLWDEAVVMESLLGVPGRYLFLLIGLATLFSTQLTLVDGVSRSMADTFHNSFGWCRRWPESAWYASWAWFMMIFGVLITFILERYQVTDLGFLFNAAYIGGFSMAVYVPLTLYINLKYLPKPARPRAFNIVLMSIASMVYVGFALYCIWWEIRN